jgi:hypothetical protein
MIKTTMDFEQLRKLLGPLKDSLLNNVVAPDDWPVTLTSARSPTLAGGFHYSLGVSIEPCKGHEVSLRLQAPQRPLL